jgi:hypothetical protein
VGTATTETAVPLGQGYAAGSIVAARASSIGVAAGAATVVIDLKKNGTTILSGTITLDSGNTLRVLEAGALATPTYAAGDHFEAAITATAGGGTLPTGLLVELILDENPS